MITVLNFTKKDILLGREIATTFVRRRLNEEAKRLQLRYDDQKNCAQCERRRVRGGGF
jgi:hypothetical protein